MNLTEMKLRHVGDPEDSLVKLQHKCPVIICEKINASELC